MDIKNSVVRYGMTLREYIIYYILYLGQYLRNLEHDIRTNPVLYAIL